MYPKNLNVAATLAISGIGMNNTKVDVIVDPGISSNVHEITVSGPAGFARFLFENLPSTRNPKTSMVTALSVASSVMAELE